jgi:hypothetical protein
VIPEIRTEVRERGITRLCHFTPSRNLGHIARGDMGLLSTAKLEADERRLFNATDLRRFDGRKTHISCSVEYPNAWYFDIAAANEHLFHDWVVLAVEPDPLWDDVTLFCPNNAAKSYGAGLMAGYAAFSAMFADHVGKYRRGAKALWCPTDEQAEVMVKDQIPLVLIKAVIVRDVGQAKREAVRLEMLKIKPESFTWLVAPVLFRKWELSSYLQSGRRPSEELWVPG